MEMKWGIVPDMGGMALLPRLVRSDVLRRLTYTAEVFEAPQALDWGLLSEVTDDPLARALALAAEIAGKNPEAIRAAKRLIGVAETAKREAETAAETLLESMAEDAEAVTGERPELLLREGDIRDVLSQLLDEDPLISLLVLAAAKASDGPGPLVSALARGKGLFSSRAVPVTVVPGDMETDEIDALV